MNDFHMLDICIKNNDRLGAMRLLRDKTEFAVRKILEKLKVKVTLQTGRPFWLWVQNWINSSCKHANTPNEPAYDKSKSQDALHSPVSRCTESGSPGFSEAGRTNSYVCGSRKHTIPCKTRTAPVCLRPDGFSSVHAYLGYERTTHTRTSSEKSKQAVGMGIYHTTGVFSRFSASSAVVCAEHFICIRRRDAAACPELPVRKKRDTHWCTTSVLNGVATATCKLRFAWDHAGDRTGVRLLRTDSWDVLGRHCRVHTVALQPEWCFAYNESASRHPAVCHSADAAVTHDSGIACSQSLF